MRELRILAGIALLSCCWGCSSEKTEPLGPGDAGDGAVDDGATGDAGTDAGRMLPAFCDPPVPPLEALRKMGEPAIAIGGRRREPTGTQLDVGGFPVQALAHPTLEVAYVANTGYAKRALEVIDAESGTVLQEIDRGELFYGLAISRDGTRLYSAGGAAGRVDAYDVAADGRLTMRGSVAIDGYPAGLALSPDGARLWVAQFRGDGIVEVNTSTLTAGTRIALELGPYHLALLSGRNELWATGFADTRVAIINLASGTVAQMLDVGSNPVDLAVRADESVVYTAAADGETVLAIDPATRAIATTMRQGDASLVDSMGELLPATSPTGLALDETSGRLYVARAADDTIAVLDATTLAEIGLVPVGWYPTDVAITASGTRLVATNGKGTGTGPLMPYTYGADSGKARMRGSVSVVDLGAIDLAALTARARTDWLRPNGVFPFTCDGTWPVPPVSGGPTPIEHIVLIERENKTYDVVLGDLGTGDGDPSLVLYGEDVTPNLHALARRFTNADNFYSDAESSIQGHFWLTSSFVNDYIERTWLEDYRGHGDFSMDAVKPEGVPDMGTFFTHLLRYGIDFTIYGEVVGSTGTYMGQSVSRHIDTRFPGAFFNTDIKDEAKARYVAGRIAAGVLAPFTYVLLPNDHTNGLGASRLTPEAMISDNDYGTGLIVEALSHSPLWRNTAVFITQDDSQIGGDHVDYHRTVLVVASPWARRGGTTSVHTSFPSLFRTFEHILGVPPMNRYDALATPLYDAFTSVADEEPYTAEERRVPDLLNDGTMPMSWHPPPSQDFRFAGPDRVPDLGRQLWEARRSDPYPGVTPGDDGDARGRDLDDDDALERDAYDNAWRGWLELLDQHPELAPPY